MLESLWRVCFDKSQAEIHTIVISGDFAYGIWFRLRMDNGEIMWNSSEELRYLADRIIAVSDGVIAATKLTFSGPMGGYNGICRISALDGKLLSHKDTYETTFLSRFFHESDYPIAIVGGNIVTRTGFLIDATTGNLAGKFAPQKAPSRNSPLAHLLKDGVIRLPEFGILSLISFNDGTARQKAHILGGHVILEMRHDRGEILWRFDSHEVDLDPCEIYDIYLSDTSIFLIVAEGSEVVVPSKTLEWNYVYHRFIQIDLHAGFVAIGRPISDSKMVFCRFEGADSSRLVVSFRDSSYKYHVECFSI